MKENSESQKSDAITESILELGSTIVGRKLTIDEAYKHFMKINSRKVELCHDTERTQTIRGCVVKR